MTEQQIKSKERVSDFGEVYTAKKQVNDMLDCVKDQSFDPKATFLEPACGNGNFLTEILRRKLSTVVSRKNVSARFEMDALQCLASIYGVDIQPDNVDESRERLVGVVSEVLGNVPYDGFWKTARLILGTNIICGDTLTAKTMDGADLVFSDWSFEEDGSITRREHRFSDMLDGTDDAGKYIDTYRYMVDYKTNVA